MLAAIHANSPGGPLVPAVAVSIALHAAVLMGVPEFAHHSPDAPRAPLNARLSLPEEPPGVAPQTVPVESEPPRAQPRPPERPVDKPARPHRQAEQATSPPPAVVPDVARAAAPRPAPETAAVPVVEAARAERGAPAGEPTLVPRAAPDALDIGSLAQYRLALIGTAKRHKLYPAYAIERGWQGRVSVELAIASDGSVAAASVKRSSGHEVLDREALEMLRKAAVLTPVPPALKSREFRLDVPVLFELSSG